MKTYERENLIEKLLALVFNKDKIEFLNKIQKKNKKELYQYLEDELFSANELKELISSINYSKDDIINIIYNLIKLYLSNEGLVFNKTKNLFDLASKHNFNWPNNKACLNKIEEEVIELKKAVKKNDVYNVREELGDIIFSLVSFATLSKIEIIECLDFANNKFENRFKKLIKLAKDEKIDLTTASTETKEYLWQKVKKQEDSS